MASGFVVRTIREQIADHIRTDVLSGGIPPGERLREQELAARYGVSRGPIRDALLQLTQEGVLVARPNCGVEVSPPLAQELQPLVVDLRRRIELFALDRVMAAPSEPVLLCLEGLAAGLERACRAADLAAIAEGDMAFHRALIEAGGGPELAAIWVPIVVRMMLHYTRHTDLVDSYREHADILRAIRAGDADAAARALVANIQ